LQAKQLQVILPYITTTPLRVQFNYTQPATVLVISSQPIAWLITKKVQTQYATQLVTETEISLQNVILSENIGIHNTNCKISKIHLDIYFVARHCRQVCRLPERTNSRTFRGKTSAL